MRRIVELQYFTLLRDRQLGAYARGNSLKAYHGNEMEHESGWGALKAGLLNV